MLRLIETKRDGRALGPEDYRRLAADVAAGRVPDYQTAAFLMAAYIHGLDETETLALTLAMRDSGAVLDFATAGLDPTRVVDKHSTGGVGDTVSFIAAPVAAALGAYVPMIAGRGLGHTGGTLDKLEAVPGATTKLSLDRFTRLVAEHGLAICGQTADIAPADRVLYSLRDVTGTVASRPLIAASIMSKKLAEGLAGLVMDVKCGAGAFMPSLAEATKLSDALKAIGAGAGLGMRALVTAMDQPLAPAVGNALEMAVAARILRGEGEALDDNLVAVSRAVAVGMVRLAGLYTDDDEAAWAVDAVLADGSAWRKLLGLVAAQGGDPACLEDTTLLPAARLKRSLAAPASGFLARLDAGRIGRASVLLGAGRSTVDEAVDPAVGFVLLKRVGDGVDAGEPWVEVHANDADRLQAALPLLEQALVVDEARPPRTPVILSDSGVLPPG